MKLIGYAFLTGRIDFLREDNAWAFSRIDSGMKQNQKDRIRLDPAQAPVELRSAPVNGDEVPVWMESMQRILRSANSIYLQFKSGVLRFRRSNHDLGSGKTFITLGNQDEADLFAADHWQHIRYLYAHRRPAAFCFDVTTMISHKPGAADDTRRLELGARLDCLDPESPQFTFDATGSGVSNEIIEWRATVKEGEIGRFAPDKAHLEVSLRNVNQPLTLLHEDRAEFNNHSYTFLVEKTRRQLERLVDKRLIAIDAQQAQEAVNEESVDSTDAET